MLDKFKSTLNVNGKVKEKINRQANKETIISTSKY